MRRPDRRARGSGWRVALVILVLFILQFYARPRLWDGPAAPDFLLVALLLLAIRTGPGPAAVLGFLSGLIADVLTPAHFGTAMLAHTVVGYLASQGRSVVFADNLLVTSGVFALGVWLRNAIMLLASATAQEELIRSLLVWSPLQALTTSLAGVALVILFRNWLAIRLDE